MLTIINILNFIIIVWIVFDLATTYLKYRSYKKLYGKHYKNLFNKYINQRYNIILPNEKSKEYKKVKKKLFDSGWEISVYQFIFLKIILLVIGCMLLMNVTLTNKSSQIEEIIQNINYGKLSTELKLDDDNSDKAIENQIYNKVKDSTDAGSINDENINSYVLKVKKYIESNLYNLKESSEIVARRILQKIIDIKNIEDSPDDYIFVMLAAVLLYFTPDLICFIRKYLIEDKKHWETVISIFTYCIFAQIPPYKTQIIVDNIIEVTDVYKTTFEKISYGIKNGKGEQVIDEMIKSIGMEEELLELLETLKLTITTGVEKTVDNMELLAQNAIEWQKIKQSNRRNKKYLILIPLLLIVFMLCFDYVMYGLTEIITTFKIDM